MDGQILNNDQRAQLEQMIAQQADESQTEVTPEAAKAAIAEGAQMAQADAQQAAAQAAQPNPDMQALSELGFENVGQLVESFKKATSDNQTMRELLEQLTALKQAAENAEDVDPNDPNSAVKKAVRDELAPLLDEAKRKAKNRLVQDAWNRSAADKADLGEFMPAIQQYIKDHPELSVAEDGLNRAYDAVRSQKYRSEESLLSDPEFVKKAAANEQIRNAVLESHLQNVARAGSEAPEGIGDGGGIPMTGRKERPKNLKEAKAALMGMLSREG